MICETCHGNGFTWTRVTAEHERPEPCPECGGCGTSHCCDGDQPSARDIVLSQARAPSSASEWPVVLDMDAILDAIEQVKEAARDFRERAQAAESEANELAEENAELRTQITFLKALLRQKIGEAEPHLGQEAIEGKLKALLEGDKGPQEAWLYQ